MKLFFTRKTKKRVKRTFFLFMAILFFCYSIFPSFGAARSSSSSVDRQVYISESSTAEIEAVVETESESHEATEEKEQEYDPKPKTEGDVQEWIDKYLDSDNDASEKPNWEKEVDKELMPEGWKTNFVEGGDEHFDKDYYTIFLDYDPQPEKIEEVQEWIENYEDSDLDGSEKLNWEEKIDEKTMPNGWEIEFVKGGDEHFDGDYYTFSLVYDPQPEKTEEVQEWIDKYIASDHDASEKPNWGKEVDEELMPEGWYNDLVEGGDEHFEVDYFTIFQVEEESEEETFEYDSQPKTKEEVQEWIDKFEDSNYDPSVKPHWEFDIEKDLMPKNWKTDFVEGGDEYFGLDFYTIFPDVKMARFYMYGGKIINNASVFNGGGVGIVSGHFVMHKGLIAGNQTTYVSTDPSDIGVATGASVMVGRSDILGVPTAEAPEGTFIMKGGTITGNHAIASGGGVSVEDASKFTMGVELSREGSEVKKWIDDS